MKHLKKFENFYLSNDTETPEEESEEMDEQGYLDRVRGMREVSPDDCDPEIDPDCDPDPDEEEKIEVPRRRVWGDEVIEERKKSKKKDLEEDEEDESPKSTGLTAKQKKLPKGLQAAILKRRKKK
jgi:hypothetical protein